jgi:NTP pyrophosphatase (non-canonical NTP hydrolase)
MSGSSWTHPLIPDETDGVKGGASIYAMALDRWGYVPQMLKTVEECGELITALMHALDGRGTPEEVASEIADVQIMCEQMALVYGTGLVAAQKREKLSRLAGLLGRPAA